MRGALHTTNVRVSADSFGYGAAVAGMLIAFWVSVWLEPIGALATGLRAVIGILLLFLPGALLTRLLHVGDGSARRFVLFTGGLGLAVLAVLTVVANLALPHVGVEAPLTFWPFTTLLIATILGLVSAVFVVDQPSGGVQLNLTSPTPVLLLAFALPTIAAGAAVLLRRNGSNAGMYVFVAILGLVVLLTATRAVHPDQYAIVVFLVALSALLHVNLVVNHVVGSDIQGLYFAASRIQETGAWTLGYTPSAYALPVVTAVPAMVATVTGVELWATFTTIYVSLFALVPVGIYSVGRHAFDARVGLFGALFFAFYHISFTYTPGKQLMAELFVVLLLALFVQEGLDHPGRKVAAVLLMLGLVFAHYGTTYLFGFALLVATIGLMAVYRGSGLPGHSLSLPYPVFLLAMASGWYVTASKPLVDRLFGAPIEMFRQIIVLISEREIPGGSGASYVARQTSLFEILQVSVYVLLTVLIMFGVAWTVLIIVRHLRRGERSTGLELTAIAVPLIAFLGSSYIVILGLYADRVYQLVLTVAAPFAAVGYQSIRDCLARVVTPLRDQWTPLAAVLVVLLALNSGMAFATFEEGETATFNPDAHETTFPAAERAGATWLATYSDATASESLVVEDSLEARDFPDRVPVYTDIVSFQLLRSVLATSHYDVEVVVLKTAYQPTIRYDRIDEGYIFVRERAIDADPGTRRPVPPEFYSSSEAASLTEPRDVVYHSGDVWIVAVGYGPGGNWTDGQVGPRTDTDVSGTP